MSKTLRGQWLAAILTAGVVGGVAASARAETLADAIALAYETNPNLQAQRATQRALDESYVQQRSGWRPTISMQVLATDSDNRVPRAARGTAIDTNGDGIPDSIATPATSGISQRQYGSAGVNFSQPIWTGGRTAAAVSAGMPSGSFTAVSAGRSRSSA